MLLPVRGRRAIRVLRAFFSLFAVVAVWAIGSLPARAQTCPGDCGEDGEVTVNELITCVNIALGESSMDACPAADADGNGAVAINDLIAAVNAALSGCLVSETGSIRVQLTGNLPASQSVAIRVDDGATRPLSPGEQLSFTDVEPGTHQVLLSDLPENCQVSGGDVWPANVLAGQTSDVSFDVTCSGEVGGDEALLAVLQGAGTYGEGEASFEESDPSDPFAETAEDGSIWVCTTHTVSAEEYPDDYATFNPNAEVVYPGSMLQGATLEDATPEPLLVERAGGILTINLLNGSPGTYQWVDQVKQSTVVQAINDILAENTGVVPARFTYQSWETQSLEQLALSLQVNVTTLTTDFQASLGFSSDKKYNRFLVEMTQSYYTVSFDLPTSLDDLFAPGVTADNLEPYVGPGNPATYISSVTYGRRFYLLIESTASTTEMKASIQASYDSAVVGGELQAGMTYVKDLSDVNIKVFALGGDHSLAVATFNADPQALGAFLTEGADIRTGVPLSYVVRNVLDNTVVNVKVATDYDVKTCSLSGAAFYSGFNGNAEGWTSYSNGISEPLAQSSTSCAYDRGGCIALQDGTGDSTSPDGQFRAPTAWRADADWSRFYGGTLRYAMRVECQPGQDCSGGVMPLGDDVIIKSPYDTLYLNLPKELIADMLDGWQDVRIELHESGTRFGQGVTRRWQVEVEGKRCDATRAEIKAVLSDVTDFRVRADHLSGTDNTWLDEVSLVAPLSPEEGCTSSGGDVRALTCCEGAGDFPDMCGDGCGECPPQWSEEVQACYCGPGLCFDGARCVVPITPTCEVEPDVLRSGQVSIATRFDWTGTDEWVTSALDVDGGATRTSSWHTYPYIFPAPYDMTQSCTKASSGQWRFVFNNDYWNLKKVPFDRISPRVIQARLALGTQDPGTTKYDTGDVFVLRTDTGNVAKVKVVSVYDSGAGWPDEYHRREVTLKYATYLGQ